MLDYNIYLKEIILMIEKIEDSVGSKSFEDFVKDSNLFDAALMRLHVIGETIKSIPFAIKRKYKNVRWKKFAKLRDIIGHKYSRVNEKIIWDVVKNLPELKNNINSILKDDYQKPNN